MFHTFTLFTLFCQLSYLLLVFVTAMSTMVFIFVLLRLWGGAADERGEGWYEWAWLAWGYHPVQIFL